MRRWGKQLMNKDLSSRLASYYALPLAEQQATRKLVLEVANADPTAFVELIHQQKFETVTDELTNNLPVFYEALAADLNKWGGFFIQEAQRLFTLARTAKAPQKILTYLDEFCFIKAAEFQHRDALVALLSKELESELLAARYYAASLLPDFIKPTDFKTIEKLRQLLHDSDWRVRYRVYGDLKDLNLLSEHDALSWIDKLRAQIGNPFNLN
jgi:hypothetical protein